MTPRQRIDGDPNFTFVNLGNAAPEQQRQNTSRRLARSHTARVIRRKQRSETRDRPGGESSQPLSATSSAAFSDAGSSAGYLGGSSGLPTPFMNSVGEPSSATAGSEEQLLRSAVIRRASVPRSVSPVFGALSAEAFGTGSSNAASQAADYCLNVDWANLLTPAEASSWFEMFCKHPVIFHGFNYASAIHQDILRNQVSRSTGKDTLAHKAETFRLLKELVPRLDDSNVELILFAVMIMWHYDLREEEIRDADVLPFSPHMPGANWLTVYGRTEGVEAHARPVKALLERAGGIQGLKLPGLAFAISCGELIAASIAFQKPSLPLYWIKYPPIHEMFQAMHISLAESPGIGFHAQVPGGLTQASEMVLLELSAVDVLMSENRQRRMPPLQEKMLVDARNAAQYRLLSLPPWEELHPAEQEGRLLAAYECCRITATIYSNSVIFPLPLTTGWHRKLIARLRGILECSNMVAWSLESSSLLIWCLFIGGIAAYRSCDRSWFESTLQKALCKAQVLQWIDVERVLNAFLWSREACSIGAAALWDAVEVDVRTDATSQG